VNQLA